MTLSPAERMLPPQRQKVMDFIHAEIDAGRDFPRATAVQAHMHWKWETSARDCLFKLCTYDKVITRGPDGSYRLPRAT